IQASLSRQYQARHERVRLDLRVVDVASEKAFTRPAVFASLEVLMAAEAFRDGRAGPALGWSGDPPLAEERVIVAETNRWRQPDRHGTTYPMQGGCPKRLLHASNFHEEQHHQGRWTKWFSRRQRESQAQGRCLLGAPRMENQGQGRVPEHRYSSVMIPASGIWRARWEYRP
ncbi:MAG: hypothetical protein ACREV8_08010, partial [Gammaproteobacteria bacterium]